jgi:hypothetical protein
VRKTILVPALPSTSGWKSVNALTGADHKDSELATFLHDPRQRLVATDTVCLVEHDSQAQPVGFAPAEHVLIHFPENKCAGRHLQLLEGMTMQVNDQATRGCAQ